MSIQTIFDAGATLYAVIHDGSGRAWNPSTGAFEAPTADNWSALALPMADDGTGFFTAEVPASLPIGTYTAVVHEQAGASPEPADPEVAAGPVEVAGVAVPTSATAEAFGVDDEQLVTRAGKDFMRIVPRDEAFAHGTDGAFAAGDRWMLTSAGSDFSGQGVQAGQVCQLERKSTKAVAPMGADEVLIVAATYPATEAGGSVLLRRKGQATRTGRPPGPIAGETGVTFTVLSAGSQVRQHAREVAKRYGLFDLATLKNPDDFREVVLLRTLAGLYRSAATQSSDKETKTGDDFWTKSKAYDAAATAELARLDRVYPRAGSAPQVGHGSLGGVQPTIGTPWPNRTRWPL